MHLNILECKVISPCQRFWETKQKRPLVINEICSTKVNPALGVIKMLYIFVLFGELYVRKILKKVATRKVCY